MKSSESLQYISVIAVIHYLIDPASIIYDGCHRPIYRHETPFSCLRARVSSFQIKIVGNFRYSQCHQSSHVGDRSTYNTSNSKFPPRVKSIRRRLRRKEIETLLCLILLLRDVSLSKFTTNRQESSLLRLGRTDEAEHAI